jgi:hypothetical protein
MFNNKSLKILGFAGVDSKLRLIADNLINNDLRNDLFSDFVGKISECSLICLCGTGTNKICADGVTINNISKAASEYNPFGIFFGISINSILIALPGENARELLTKLHSLLFLNTIS